MRSAQLAAFLVAFACFGAFAISRGPAVAPDTARYVEWSSHLTSFASSPFMVPPLTYAGFVGVVALMRAVFGASWEIAIVVLNVIAAAAAVSIVAGIVERATHSKGAIVAAVMLCIGALDILMWIPMVVSDVTYMLLVVSLFASCVRG